MGETSTLIKRSSTVIIVRHANEEHVKDILRLQDENLSRNLSELERTSGFLSVQFKASDFRRFITDLGVAVAVTESAVLGYCLAKTLTHAQEFPLLSRCIQSVLGTRVGEIVLAPENTVFLGPVCVARAYRSQGIMSELYAFICGELGKRYQCGITLVAENNMASLSAHLSRSFLDVASLTHEGMKFHVLARPLVMTLAI